MTFRQKPTVDSPLGELIAGRIDQAEYRRRRAAQLQAEHLELHVVEPQIADFALRLEEDRPRSGWIFAWVLAIALIAIVAFVIANRSAAPRTGPDPTAPPPASSVAGLALALTVSAASASGPGLFGAPLERSIVVGVPRPSRHDGGAPQTLDPRVGREGDIAHTGSGGRYLAIPLGPGVRIRICGPAACLVATSTDAGPDHDMLEAGRIADIDVGRWELICGVPASFGLCPGSWVVWTGDQPTLPPTDVAP